MMTTKKEYEFNKGLTQHQVDISREKFGVNRLTPPKKTSLWKLYLDKYKDPIIQILIVAALISLALSFIQKEFIETIGIFIAIFLATTIGFYFEHDAAGKFSILTSMTDDQNVKVRRDGKVIEIPRYNIVVGDIVLVEVGDEIPADGKLIESTDLQIDESSLTGELISSKEVQNRGCTNDALQKDIHDTSSDKQQTGRSLSQHPQEQESTYPKDMLLRSTMVMNGRGIFAVTAVGDNTEIGKVAQKSTEETDIQTPLNQQLHRLANRISKIGTSIAIIAFIFFLGHDMITQPVWHSTNYLKMAEIVLNYFMMSVTLIVMAVPEGLPMAVTLSLALNMRRMLRSNNLVRKLHACETMGAVNVICTDKTGTLTRNQMTVTDMYTYDLKNYSLEENSQLLYLAIALNTTAELNDSKGIGNPTEIALLQWLKNKNVDYQKLRQENAITHQEPFSTQKKYMLTTATLKGVQHTFIKGAPEIILNHCNLDEKVLDKVYQQLTEYQNKAMRTLAFSIDGKLQAIAGIFDPIRDDVPEAVKICRKAGIEIKIVTGDTANTAVEIGRRIGLFSDNKESYDPRYTITGPEWAALNTNEAYKRAPEIKVMSRARPTDKQRLVELLQKRGAIVAVTGDGTNDAPALHYAHVGLSLGSGTSVAKSASDMTLLDDSFSSIANAVMWGRSLYKNIQRFLFFQLVVNLAALLLVLGGSIIGTEMPLTVTQILWVNLIMDTFAAMALASLPPSREVMNEKPRNQKEFIITSSIMKHILGWGITFFILLFGYLFYYKIKGTEINIHELTIFFTAFVMLQFWNLFNAKCLGSHHSAFHHLYADRGLLIVLAIIFIGQVVIVTFGGKMFRTTPLNIKEWIAITIITSVVLWIGETIRGFQRLHKH